MKQIQEYNADTGEWRHMGQAYSGLSDEKAKEALAELRKWAKDDKSGKKYRAVNVVIVPR